MPSQPSTLLSVYHSEPSLRGAAEEPRGHMESVDWTPMNSGLLERMQTRSISSESDLPSWAPGVGWTTGSRP